jgi:NAD+ kinase
MSSIVPWGPQAHCPDVVIVQKKTALERYATELKTEPARSFLLKDGQTDDSLRRAHDLHRKTVDSLLDRMNDRGLSYSLYTLDDFTEHTQAGGGLGYFNMSNQQGIQSHLRLVICVGGDGTLLRTSHYVGGSMQIVGLNSVPQHSVGHLCALTPSDLDDPLDQILSGRTKPHRVRRLQARTTSGQQLPYALNDIFFGHQHPASASRYTLTIEGPQRRSEKQVSSGLWLATPAGSTAAIHSYGLGTLDAGAEQFLLAVREPYAHGSHHPQLTSCILDGNTESVTLFSRMRHGIVCVDGPVTACVLGFGEALEVSLPEEGRIALFLN